MEIQRSTTTKKAVHVVHFLLLPMQLCLCLLIINTYANDCFGFNKKNISENLSCATESCKAACDKLVTSGMQLEARAPNV